MCKMPISLTIYLLGVQAISLITAYPYREISEQDYYWATKSFQEIQNQSCGTSFNGQTISRQARIINGARPTLPHENSHVVVFMNEDGTTFCGGSLIHPKFVLTAGHCVEEWAPDNVLVIGTEDLLVRTNGLRFRSANAIFRHPKFDLTELFYDIAIIELNKPVKSSQQISYACLIPKGQSCDPMHGKSARMAGFGKIDPERYSTQTSRTLQVVNLPLIQNKECKKFYGLVKFAGYYICAGYVRGLKDSCGGDSGGPLTIGKRLWNNLTQIAVASWGFDCGQPMKPGVYTCLGDFRQWIEDHIASKLKDFENEYRRGNRIDPSPPKTPNVPSLYDEGQEYISRFT